MLATALAMALAFQLLAADDIALPVDTVLSGGPAAGVTVSGRPSTPDGRAIIARSVFAPPATPAVASSAPETALGGYVFAGSIQIGQSVLAVVQAPGNRTFPARAGAMIGGWRLQSVSRTGARLSRGRETLTVRFGPSGGIVTSGKKEGSAR